MSEQFASIDRAGTLNLGQGLTSQPKSAIPLNIPLPTLKPTPDGTPPRVSPGEAALVREEQAAVQQFLKNQREQQLAREAEIFKREQAQRDALRQRLSPAEPPANEPRITNRNPEWEQPRPTSKSPTQPPPPSSATLPTTPNTSGARLNSNISPTATPSPVGLLEEIPTAPLPQAKPRGTPQPAGTGLAKGSAIGAGIDAANRLVHGQPPLQAGFGAAGNFAGSLIGAGLGSGFGPAGMFVGGLIGGMVGGAIADLIYNAAFPPKAEPPPTTYNAPPPFKGGQIYGRLYSVEGAYIFSSGQIFNMGLSPWLPGPIGGMFKGQDGNKYGIGVVHGEGVYFFTSLDLNETSIETAREYYKDYKTQFIVNITPQDGEEDPINPPAPPPPRDNRTPPSVYYPGDILAPPRGEPGAGQKPAPNNYVPGSKNAGGSPRGDSPDWIPHGGLAPGLFPNPTTTPNNLGGGLPFADPAPLPQPTTPADQSYPKSFGSLLGSSSPSPNNFGSNNVQPIPIGSPSNSKLVTPIPTTSPAKPVPDANSPTPKNQNPTTPNPTTTPNPELDDLREQMKRLGEGLAVLTLILKNPIPQPVNKGDIQSAVCEIAQPQGCLGAPIKKAEDAANANGNKLDQINALLNGLDLAGTAGLNSKLDTINNKLGDQLPGGLGGKLERLSKWLHLDRALNILIWWQTLHNAYMLSANLGQTLTSAISNVLAAVGIKDAEGSPLDLGEIIGNQFDNLAKTVIGESEWGSIKAEYKKWNRIYQAAANLRNSIISIGQSILGALEIVGSWVALIGNGLKKYGKVTETAYKWMNPQPNFQNRFFTVLENTEDVISQIDAVAGEVLSVQDSITQIATQKEELSKALRQEPQSKQGTLPPEATQVKTGFDASKIVSANGVAITDADKEAD